VVLVVRSEGERGWSWSSRMVSEGTCHGHCVVGLSLEVGRGCEGVGGGVVGSSLLSGEGALNYIITI
jgi:hypothetical protein